MFNDGRRLAEKNDKKPVKKARLIYNQELEHFYNEITVTPPKVKTHIYHISPPPVDIDKFNKVFVNQDGINPDLYTGTGNFSMPHKEFYLKLFSYRKADPPNANLLFFLTDFTKDNKNILIEDMEKAYILGTSS